MKRPRGIATVILLATAVLSSSACAESHTGAPIQGRVVDAGTRQPVADVIVVAEWRLEGGLHTDTIGRLHLQETVTDEQGIYRLPAWGPIKVEKGRLDVASPIIHFYKRGYRFKTERNDIFRKRDLKVALRSDWDNKTIELMTQSDALTREGYGQERGEAAYLYSVDEKKCAWRQFPRMTAELMKRQAEYEKHDISTSFPHPEGLRWGGRCPDPATVLREYLQ